MSGIAGIYRRGGESVKESEIAAMTEALNHRGPDGIRAWCKDSVGLGHLKLASTPESVFEKYPMSDSAGQTIITADARIDNRAELATALGLEGQPLSEVPDGELILKAYLKWGEGCTQHLDGDFAFAIWDAREQKLFCARDRFGVKPFYYFASDNLFAFASEIKGIFAVSGLPRRLNEVRVAEYLSSIFDDPTQTFYQGVFRLPPAHSLTMDREKVHVRRYWTLDPSSELHFDSDDEYTERFLELFSSSVKNRIRSSFPVGSLLSGGLDSSSITCMARNLQLENGNKGLATFSAVFEDVPESDERTFINSVLSQNSIAPNFIAGDKLSPLANVQQMQRHLDEPVHAFNLFLNWNMLEAANNQGVRVLLDGFDGDTTVSHGTAYLAELANKGRWLTLAREVKGYAKNFDDSAIKLMLVYLWNSGANGKALRRWTRRAKRRIRGQESLIKASRQTTSVLNPSFAHDVGLYERIRDFRRPSPNTESEHHYQRLTWGVMPHTLETLDAVAAPFAVEPRYPFWDRKLVEFCLSLPPEQKIRSGWTRFILRNAMSGILPPEIQWRARKSNLGHNFKHTLLKYGRQRMDEAILGNTDEISAFIDVPKVQSDYKHFVAGSEKDTNILGIWNAVNLSIWLKESNIRA